MTVHRKQHDGVTLVELIMSIVIISISLVGIFTVITVTTQHSADPLAERQAIAIAESYMEEILLQGYAGGTSTGRANFDDVTDYNNLTDVGAHDQSNHAIVGLEAYTVTVAVSAATSLADGVNAKKITVSVSGPGIPNLSLVGYRGSY